MAPTPGEDEAPESAGHPAGRLDAEDLAMADLAYVLLLIVGFALLALTLRGLDAL